MKTQWLLILALVFALVTAIFAVINVNMVEVNFIFATTNIPLILVIVGSTLLGGIIMGTFGISRQYQLQKKIHALETKFSSLPTNPPSQQQSVVTTPRSEPADPLPLSVQD